MLKDLFKPSHGYQKLCLLCDQIPDRKPLEGVYLSCSLGCRDVMSEVREQREVRAVTACLLTSVCLVQEMAPPGALRPVFPPQLQVSEMPS